MLPVQREVLIKFKLLNPTCLTLDRTGERSDCFSPVCAICNKVKMNICDFLLLPEKTFHFPISCLITHFTPETR